MSEFFVEADVPQNVADEAMGKARAIMASQHGKKRGKHQIGSELERIAHGLIGEAMFHALYGGERVESYEHDVLLDGLRYEVKTIGNCTAYPRTSFDAVVNSSTLGVFREQEADRYVFARLLGNKIIFVGWMECDLFHKRATEHPAGTPMTPGGEPSVAPWRSLMILSIRTMGSLRRVSA